VCVCIFSLREKKTLSPPFSCFFAQWGLPSKQENKKKEKQTRNQKNKSKEININITPLFKLQLIKNVK